MFFNKIDEIQIFEVISHASESRAALELASAVLAWLRQCTMAYKACSSSTATHFNALYRTVEALLGHYLEVGG